MARKKRAQPQDPVDRFESLFLQLQEDEEAQRVVARSRLRLLFQFEEPDGSIAVNGRERPFTIQRNPDGFRSDLALIMSCDTAHRFFLGSLDLTRALASREIRSRGFIIRMLELRALLDRARDLYQDLD